MTEYSKPSLFRMTMSGEILENLHLHAKARKEYRDIANDPSVRSAIYEYLMSELRCLQAIDYDIQANLWPMFVVYQTNERIEALLVERQEAYDNMQVMRRLCNVGEGYIHLTDFIEGPKPQSGRELNDLIRRAELLRLSRLPIPPGNS